MKKDEDDVKKMLKWVLGVGVVVFVIVPSATINIVRAERIDEDSARRAAVKEVAPTAPIAVEKPSKKSTSAKEPCQVETELEPLRELGQKLCASGTFSKVEISIEGGELLVQTDFNSLGEQVFRSTKGKFFGMGREFVDGLHTAAPQLTFVSYQMFDSTTTNIVGSCWHTRGVTQCEDYSGPTPKFVQ